MRKLKDILKLHSNKNVNSTPSLVSELINHCEELEELLESPDERVDRKIIEEMRSDARISVSDSINYIFEE